MGTYASCRLGTLTINTTKNNIDTDILSLFRPSDKVVLELEDYKNSCASFHVIDYEEWFEDNEELKVVFYEAPLSIIKDRLDILGYNVANAKASFNQWIGEERKSILNRIDEGFGSTEILEKHYIEVSNLLQHLTPELWCECIKIINSMTCNSIDKNSTKGKILNYMRENEHSNSESGWYGFPGYDLFIPLRLAVEALYESETLVYDLTQLVDAEYFNSNEDFIEYGLSISAMEYSDNSKIIILTEGKTDTWILKETFELLYPHLIDYYSFLDFDASKFGGGVGQLANVVKAFSGSGIVNNVIALFDNDTAAKSACSTILKSKIPKNISITFLPILNMLKSYPTIGPTGNANLDVNGMAASIELYLGEDVLKNDDGNLVPIQWTGFEKSVQKYQGEVIDKASLHKKFKNKLKEAKDGKYFDWKEIHEVFNVIFNAFNEKNKNLICKRASEYYSR